MTRPAPAITDDEVDAAFVPLAAYDVIVIAVSGGPDSLALLQLIADWKRRQRYEGEVHVATVDHGLRAQSAAEATFVAERAAALGLPHATLVWTGAKPATAIAKNARDARYALLAGHAANVSRGRSAAVATAHHANDQAETLLMRLARGSGIDGLAAMAPVRKLAAPNIDLVRPLLAIRKERLAKVVAALGLAAVDDPTNADETYERPRLRKLEPQLREAGLGADALALAARRLGDACAALEYAYAHFEATLGLDYHCEVFATLDRRAFDSAPAFLRQKLIERLIARFGGATPSPGLAEIEALAERAANALQLTATLGGACLTFGSTRIKVWRELGRIAAADAVLKPGSGVTWDDRFWIELAPGAREPLVLKPLGREGFGQIKSCLMPPGPPADAAAASPALWRGTELYAAPLLAAFAAGPDQRVFRPGDLTVQPKRPGEHPVAPS